MAVSQLADRRNRERLTAADDVATETQTSNLERRLIEGERHIAIAEERGEDTGRLVDFWIDLLHQYERSIDALPRAA